MKLPFRAAKSAALVAANVRRRTDDPHAGNRRLTSAATVRQSAIQAGFTMVEIAICLAVIGFALVAIIGVLPVGMNVQKDNREETVINFDANYLMDAIRSGTIGDNQLTNYVIAITNTFTLCHSNGVPFGRTHINWYTPTSYSLDGPPTQKPALTNGQVIMGLLSLPKYIQYNPNNGDYWSNSVSATFRAITGSPLDQGTSPESKDYAFSWWVGVEIVPNASYPFAYWDGTSENLSAPGSVLPAVSTPSQLTNWPAAKNLQANLNEIRLRFRWPYIPPPPGVTQGPLLYGKLGNGSQVYRTSTSGQIAKMYVPVWPGPPPPFQNYFFLQPQSYTDVP